MRNALVPVSILTLVCMCWLSLMEALLRHPGFGLRIAMDTCVAAICVATTLSSLLRAGFGIQRWLRLSAPVVIYIGAQAFIHNARSVHFEGFVFIVSLLLIVQGALMLATLGGIRPPFQHALTPSPGRTHH